MLYVVYTKGEKLMELCNSCKRQNCNKSIVIEEQDNMRVIRCLEYEKDLSKIEGYKEPIYVSRMEK